MQTKTCKECGIELPTSEFYECSETKDGLQHICKECYRIQNKEYYAAHNIGTRKIRGDNPLASFTPRELIAELKARGYTGQLKYTKTIIL